MNKGYIIAQNLIAFVLIAINCACSSTNERIEFRDDLVKETPDISEFEITEILKPLYITFNDNYLCILHEEKQQGEQIFVFDAETLDFKYKFAKRGMGPEEIIALDMVNTSRGDTIDLINQANYKKHTYLLTENGPQFIKESTINIPPAGPLQETYWLNDSILVFNTSNMDLILYDDNANRAIESINISDFINCEDKDLLKQIGTYHFSVMNGNVIVGLRFFKTLLEIPITDKYTFDVTNIQPIDCSNIDVDNLYNNYNFFAFVASGDNNLVAQYYGKRLKCLQPFPRNIDGQDLYYNIMVFDQNLKLLHTFELDTPILRVFFDEKRGRIYFWNESEDFNKLKYIKL